MIIIPLTESANNHQYYNALEYEKKWNVLINENELNNSWIDKILTFDWYKKQLLDFKNTNSLEIIKKTILK
jgi:UDP-N-acetylglucosamine:LPS N-acetylglucosamine transferase